MNGTTSAGFDPSTIGKVSMTDTRSATNRPADRSMPASWVVVTGDIVMLRSPIGCDPRVRNLLSAAQVAFGNLEVPLTKRGAPAEKAATHRASPDCAEDLQAFGLTAVTLANNHLLDYGLEGMRDTFAVLDDVGMAHVGAGENAVEGLEPAVFSTEHGTVALLGISASLPPGFAASTSRPGIAPLRVLQQIALDPALAVEQPGMAPYVYTSAHTPDLEAACAAIMEAREASDLVVVAIHWGIPHGFAAQSYGQLADYQPKAGRALIDAGADLVIGHHPHVVHPIEVYKSGLIAYSVGNLMFHNWAQFGATTEAPSQTQTDHASSFQFETPSAPYRNSFADTETLDSVLVLVQPPQPDGRLVIRFVPTTMIDGDPVIPDVQHCRTILGRLRAAPNVADEALHSLVIRPDLFEGAAVGEVILDGRS